MESSSDRVIPIEQAATLGTQGDIMLADMTQYLLAQRADVRADTSIHVAFLTGEQAFRFMLRLDGQPTWKKPLTPYQGALTNLRSSPWPRGAEGLKVPRAPNQQPLQPLRHTGKGAVQQCSRPKLFWLVWHAGAGRGEMPTNISRQPIT